MGSTLGAEAMLLKLSVAFGRRAVVPTERPSNSLNNTFDLPMV